MWVPKESVAKKMDADFKEAAILALVAIEAATHASGRRYERGAKDDTKDYSIV
jgi:hypothetical protein